MEKDIILISATFSCIIGLSLTFIIFRKYGKTENKKLLIYRWSLVGIGLILGVGGFIHSNL